MSHSNYSIGFLGSGHMTAALVGGLVKHHPADKIHASNRSQDKLQALADQYDIHAASSNQALVEASDVLVLSVKPQLLKDVVTPLKEQIQLKKPLIISVAAGIRCASLNLWLGDDLALIRAMPNTPSVIDEGACGLFANQFASAQDRTIAETIFNSVGIASWVEQEKDIDLVTAISGSGPAYFMLFVQSLIDAATARGMSKQAAKQLALQTARGTAGMIAASDKPLEQMIDDMLLPGGTTEQAVATLRQQGVPQAIDAAVNSAATRATQIADQLGA